MPITRGNAYWDNIDFDEAIADFSMAIKLKHEYADAHGYRADLYYYNTISIEYFSICM